MVLPPTFLCDSAQICAVEGCVMPVPGTYPLSKPPWNQPHVTPAESSSVPMFGPPMVSVAFALRPSCTYEQMSYVGSASEYVVPGPGSCEAGIVMFVVLTAGDWRPLGAEHVGSLIVADAGPQIAPYV